MKGNLLGSLQALFSRQRRETGISAEDRRCAQILNYWCDAELFDLPECPMDPKNEVFSQQVSRFAEFCAESKQKGLNSGQRAFHKDARLVIMLQCHRAGYLHPDKLPHPNYETPRTFLVAQAMLPKWDEQAQTLKWLRSEESCDLVLNLATMRTLYRNCPDAIPDNMALSEWIKARIETVNNRLAHELDGPLEGDGLKQQLDKINQQLADEFWPNEASREFMLDRSQPIESQLQEEDVPQVTQGSLTFRWRFCYYPRGNDSAQLGPFFVKDLESAILRLSKLGAQHGLSAPLYRYLLGSEQQEEIGEACSSGQQFFDLTRSVPAGRWPENPKYGLSLLQSMAVNIAGQQASNPVVAVNGPPGTGKTTLLKDVIAQRLVLRTNRLLALCDKEDWLRSDEAVEVILESSMVVASSNNKAVENISKELPSLGKLSAEFHDLRHFRSVAKSGDWGLLCAVLGNSDNRKAFGKLLKRLRNHMNSVEDHFQIQYLFNSLKQDNNKKPGEVIARFVRRWQANDELLELTEEIRNSKAYGQHQGFFKAWCTALEQIQSQMLTVDEFAAAWDKQEKEKWDEAVRALDRIKRQWFAQKLGKQRLKHKLELAKAAFSKAVAQYNCMIKDLNGGESKKWQLDPDTHLLGPQTYQGRDQEEPHETEARLQMSSPFGSEAVNRCRTELFLTAMALNQAMAEQAASSVKDRWDDLTALINGQLETQEQRPEHLQLWSMLYLFFPVISTSLSSVESQFRLMQKPGGFGLAMFDEAGQAVNYHVAGLLQRCRQAIFVGDPIQLEPVVTIPAPLDHYIARDFMELSQSDGEESWGDRLLISSSSAQTLADQAGNYFARIGARRVGIPLLVHRRCTEPMFSIANKIAYDDKMVPASLPYDWKAPQSGWINIEESDIELSGSGYDNKTEALAAVDLARYLCEQHPQMVKEGLYMITPFSEMRRTLQAVWKSHAKDSNNRGWMRSAFGASKADVELENFPRDNIGTVHTFQGKEASTVLLCTAGSLIRKKAGGISWVNSKPNLLNVAVTRAKHHLFVLGNRRDWESGLLTSELQCGGMKCYDSLEELKQADAVAFDDYEFFERAVRTPLEDLGFDFTSERDPDVERVRKLQQNADRGDPEAQFSLGMHYGSADEVEQDDELAVSWYRKAAELGHGGAQANLAQCYMIGRGVDKDEPQAAIWFLKAAEQGDPLAQYALGYLYKAGRGVAQDDRQAVNWYRKSAEQGNASAQANLGMMYQSGRGVNQDQELAISWYRKAAIQAHSQAINRLERLAKSDANIKP
ncbi:AAA domain-containing protein [Ferrimonas kyonanensis]|uniref:AAA domain-containing protein n=1 Tax=Ferrimonas kyonanensis TaxID=364763 RepID=UPI00040FBBB3|nr:AAA domain-containing protein [Ferrimonas kyonanensis]